MASLESPRDRTPWKPARRKGKAQRHVPDGQVRSSLSGAWVHSVSGVPLPSIREHTNVFDAAPLRRDGGGLLV